MNWILSSPLLVMHESSLQMQSCASQIYKEHYSMLNWDIDKQDSHNLSTSIANKIERDIQASDIAINKVKHFSQKLPVMSIGLKHDQTEHKQHITHKLHARSQILITRSSQTPTSYLMSCQSHRAMCPLLDMRLLIGEHHATG
jgi:hypothetical protein